MFLGLIAYGEKCGYSLELLAYIKSKNMASSRRKMVMVTMLVMVLMVTMVVMVMMVVMVVMMVANDIDSG